MCLCRAGDQHIKDENIKGKKEDAADNKTKNGEAVQRKEPFDRGFHWICFFQLEVDR